MSKEATPRQIALALSIEFHWLWGICFVRKTKAPFSSAMKKASVNKTQRFWKSNIQLPRVCVLESIFSGGARAMVAGWQ